MTGETTEEGSPALSPGRVLLVAVLVLLATAVGQGLATLAVDLARGAPLMTHMNEPRPDDGLLAAAAVLGGSVVGGTALVLLRRRALRVELGPARADVRALALGLAASAGLFAAFSAARWLSTGSPVPATWSEILAATPVPLLVLGFVIAAPLFEECFFRGLLHRSLVASRLGASGGIAVISVLFMLAHFPGDVIGALEPLAAGVLLGVVRERTGSIAVGVAMHALGNLLALVTVLALRAG